MHQCLVPFRIYQGETRSPILTVFKADGTVQNLNGATVELQVKPKAGDADTALLVDFSSAVSGCTILDQTVGSDTEGQCQFFFTPGDTSGITADEYTYDVVVILPGGERGYPITPSPFVVLPVVNQA